MAIAAGHKWLSTKYNTYLQALDTGDTTVPEVAEGEDEEDEDKDDDDDDDDEEEEDDDEDDDNEEEEDNSPSSKKRKREEEEAVESDESEDDDSMTSFQCPITHVRMTDPVTCMDGHTYERAGIEEWLANHNTSPSTGVELSSKMLLPNHSLRNAIEEYYRDDRRSKK